MKKTIVTVLAALTIFAGMSVHAEDIITGIAPSKTVSVYELGEKVIFKLSHTVSNEDRNIRYILKDVYGNFKGEGEFVIPKETDENDVTLSVPGLGWYRIYFYEGGNSASSEYCSVSIVTPYEERLSKNNSPISIDLAGQFASLDGTKPTRKAWTDEERQAYAYAMKEAGFGYVRERVSGDITLSGYKGIENQTNALAGSGLKVLNTFAEGASYTEELYDTYSRALNNALKYRGKIFAWEGKNEPDNKKTTITPDMEASSFKAASLGVLDSGTGATKVLSSIYDMTIDFFDDFMLNDVTRYADCINIHNHSGDYGNIWQRFPDKTPTKAIEFAAAYGRGLPIWCTEAGFQVYNGSGGITEDAEQPQNTRYAVTSTVESLAEYGITKHFYFLGRHFTESGNFGLFTKNHMPYASYNALSVLTNYLGEGRVLGVLRNLPSDVNGFVFDAGEYDVAVLYSKTTQAKRVQINTDKNVEIVDIMGGTKNIRYTPTNKKINIPVTIYPIIVCFDGRCDENNYYIRSFPAHDEVSVTSMTDADRVILRQRWQNADIVKSKYQMEKGTTYNIALDVANLNSKRMKGQISIEVSEGLEVVGAASASYSANACQTKELSFAVRVKDSYKRSGKAYVYFTGTAGGAKISCSTAPVFISPEGAEYIDRSLSGLSTKTKNVQKGEFLPDCEGIYLKTSDTSSGKLTIYTRDKNGITNQYWSNFSDSTEYRLVWNENFRHSLSGIKATVIPEDIYKITVSYSGGITDAGSFVFSEPKSEIMPKITISGVEDKKIYKDNKRLGIRAEIPDGLVNIKMYVNYKEKTNFDLSDGVLTAELAYLDPGAYDVMITGEWKYGMVSYQDVKFYVRDNRDYNAVGVFYN